jgi:hypothetical protein
MKKIIKIKSFLSLAIIAVTVSFIGCSEDVLDQKNNNAISTGNFGATLGQVESAVNGAFHPITGTFFWGRIVHTGAMLRSDEFNIIPNGGNTSMSTFQGGPGNGRWATEPWQELYKSIARCNNIIINTPTTLADTKSLIGQAYFLRAFDYFYLVNLYGNVPLITDLPDFDNLLVDQAAPKDVWSQIIEDLKMAETMLPAAWTGDNAGRPTAGAATALKGKSYLYMKEWANAHTALSTLVGKYSLLPAVDFGDNFGVANENNSESVFELQFLGQSNFAWGTDVPQTGTMGNYHIDYAPPSKSPDFSHIVNPWLKKLYEDNGDTFRRNETLAYNYVGSKGYGGSDYATDFLDDIQVANDNSLEPIFSKKYTGMDIGARGEVDFLGTNVGNNWRIIRYSDVLLMLSEALNEDSQSGNAVTYLNMVRQRPGSGLTVTTAVSQADVRQAIIEERAMELAGEGHRFFDLVRWELADDYMGATSLHVTNGGQTHHPKSLSGGTFTAGKHELVWIPVSERGANPNLGQNPGY